jgi:hypothetical protein
LEVGDNEERTKFAAEVKDLWWKADATKYAMDVLNPFFPMNLPLLTAHFSSKWGLKREDNENKQWTYFWLTREIKGQVGIWAHFGWPLDTRTGYFIIRLSSFIVFPDDVFASDEPQPHACIHPRSLVKKCTTIQVIIIIIII